MPATPPRVVITGVGGYGRLHLENARPLHDAGRLTIVALVDPAVAAQRSEQDGIPVHADLDGALAAHPADIVIVATPLDTHESLAVTAMNAGADVLLEKPPVPTLAAFERLLKVQQATGRSVQVGFQSLGSDAIAAFAQDSLDLGPTEAVAATGLWSRTPSYWARARWAGRRTLDGHAVVDGVATNPLAHAVATALRIAGYATAESVDRVETDLYRANAIEADDTSVIRISGAGHPTVTCALTLCAPPELHDGPDRAATVTVSGSRASASFSYTTDVVTLDGEHRSFGRTDLLENLLDHRANGAELIVPLESTGAFMRVVEAIRSAPEPTKIDPRFVTWHGEGDGAYPVIDDVVEAVRTAAASGSTFRELGVAWAAPGNDRVIACARVDGSVMAEEVDGGGTIPFSSPHPYLHPVRTVGGVTVSAAHPADHDWHTGVSFAVQDAAGVNFWGGRTYVHGSGYETLDDHGRIEVLRTHELPHGVRHELAWRAPDGAVVLEEVRSIRWRPIAFGDHRTGWALDVDVRLTPTGAAVELGSPGSKGRPAAGYGGFFWRFPDCTDVNVFTHDGTGEDAVNGSVAPWLAWSARFLAGDQHNGTASVVVAGADETTARDPWFVRVRDYPGIGSAVAWDAPTSVGADGLHRSYRAAVVDGKVGVDEAAELAALLGEWEDEHDDRAEQRAADCAVKRARVLGLLDDAGADSVLLTSPTAVAWYLDGGRSHVSLAADPIVSVRVSRAGDEVLATSNEVERLLSEELPAGVAVSERAWFEGLEASVEQGASLALREQQLDDELRAARAVLLPGELPRYRELCADAARIVTDVLLAAESTWTERRVAGELAGRLVAAGADPLVLLVSGEERASLPHPLPTDAPLGRRAMVVVCARRDGLIANLSRWVSFGGLTTDERSAQRRILRVEAAAFDAMTPGTQLSDVLSAIADAYPANGFAADQWRRHHQGGAAGYAGRDPRATPDTHDVVHLGQAFTWNPWSPGAKVEDTVLLTGTADAPVIEPLTVDPRWPVETVAGRLRPVTLER